MKNSSWLINNFISLLKKILQNIIVSLVDIAYPRDFDKDGFKKDFLCRTSCKTTSGFPSSVPPRYKVHLSSTSQVQFLFPKLHFENIDTMLDDIDHSAVHDRGRGYSNSFDSAEFEIGRAHV